MSDTVMACRQCGSSSVSKDTAHRAAGEYYCEDCGDRVHIVWRAPIGPYAHTDSQSGMARVLADMDADEVGL
jgi:transcription initiation factor TFIIIB Brf1 subunit/transcription initiation factor TFIIB